MLEWSIVAGATGAVISVVGGALMGRSRADKSFAEKLSEKEKTQADSLSAVRALLNAESVRARAAEEQLTQLRTTLGLTQPSANLSTLLTDAFVASHASVGGIADREGLVRAFRGDQDLAESLGSIAPDVLPLLELGGLVVIRGLHGGEVRAIRMDVSGEPLLVFLGSQARSISVTALRMLQASIAAELPTPIQPKAAPSFSEFEDAELRAGSHDLGLVWLARLQADALGKTGAWEEDCARFLGPLAHAARRFPVEIASPLSSIELRSAGLCVAYLSLDGQQVFLSGQVADDPAALPRIANLLARRLSKSARAA